MTEKRPTQITKPTQKELVYAFVHESGGMITSNSLRDFGHQRYIASPDRRIRELMAEGLITSRWISQWEMDEKGLKTKVKVYSLTSQCRTTETLQFSQIQNPDSWDTDN